MQHTVLTTERVPIRYRVAGLGARFLAWLVDAAVLVVLVCIGAALGSVLEAGRAGLGLALMTLWVFTLNWGYFLLFEWLWSGQTPGKRLLGLRVVRWDGTALGFYPAAVRNLLRIVDALPLPLPAWPGAVGFAAAASNREHRRLGDLAADTLVVHVERRTAPVRALPEAARAADRARLALLRQRLGQLDRQQKETLLDLCLRREQLRVTERARLFEAAAAFLQQRLDLAPAPYESSEKFVLHLAAVLDEGASPVA